jgi:hypothetical protein
MDTQQPANRITVEQAKAITEALNPGVGDEDTDEDEYSTEYEYEEWDE